MGILSSKYRTYVLNDFSSVKKAVFFILKFDANFGHYKVKECLPVQINPNSIKQHEGYSGNFKYKGGSLQLPKESNDDEVLELSLEYNIYDEYNVTTMGGMEPPSPGSISLSNPKAVTLEKLKSYAGKLLDDDCAKLRTLFVWGDIEWFGALLSVDVEYTSFSKWGEPLSAKVDVKVQKEYLRDDKDNPFYKRGIYSEKSSKPTENKELAGIASASVKAYSAAADAVMLLEGVGGALR